MARIIRNYVQIDDNTMSLELTNSKYEGVVFFDMEDYPSLSKYSWKITHIGYCDTKIEGKTISMHQFLMGKPPKGNTIDHEDRDKLNNRRTNLNFKTQTEQNLNWSKRCSNTSGRTGVYYLKVKNKSDAWRAKVEVNGKLKTREFSISKYGERKAFELACKAREEFELRYNITTEK